MCGQFQIARADLEGYEILLASYNEVYGYDGEAFVLLRKNGTLYEVNAGHCSCYGLEGQWEIEATTISALRMRDLSHAGYAAELTALLDQLDAPGVGG